MAGEGHFFIDNNELVLPVVESQPIVLRTGTLKRNATSTSDLAIAKDQKLPVQLT